MEPTQETEMFGLRFVEGGGVRVGNTRVSLDSVVYTFREGVCADEIVERFPSLTLADTYAAVAFYLRHRDVVDGYLEQREREADAIRTKHERDFPMRPSLRAKLDAALAARAAAESSQ